ncbi:unnamed protein product [Medioppia subpectinata]|uniref:DNA polymerase delta subunit 3 n=1 Tax=Medioppia subpectinata TaxID=1979941 RepID=A0A7R9KT84_9ACAR|nr:unnamed protein product [Medioppia subpectinata]CAG2108003.1 unnamed protein product [Medioppia subpectinata]
MMDSMNHLMKELSKLVLEDNKCISYTYISVKFRLHVKQAIELLDQFVSEERKNGNHLCLNYLLSGNNDTKTDDNETKMERFMILEESEVESATEWFHNGVNKHIYSVSLTEDNNSIDLNINEYEGDVKDQNYINDLQNLTYIKNPNINLRTTRRRTGIKPTVDIKEEKKDEEKKSSLNGKQVVENKSKPKNNTKGKGKQKNKISNMFSKNKTVEKEEKESTEATNESDDPFKSDSEEETKPEVKDEDMNGNDSAEEVVIENEPKVNTKKRHSKNESNDSSDEEIVRTKKRDKKYKRVRLISDSDSDEPKESAIDKYVKTREVNQKPVKKMEKKQETHVDEDGYLVTKTVTKEVEVNTESDAKPVVNKEKPKPIKEDKIVEKKSKPKPINDKKNKNQSSITSFFKPKQLST